MCKSCAVFVPCQAQWEYLNNTDYEQYPEEINIIIENAYQDKKPYAEWEEENARYRLTFETMEEEMANDPSSKVKVRRNTKGELLQPSSAARGAVSASVTLCNVDALQTEFVECTRGVQKVHRPTQLTTRYAHHILSLFDILLQLKCNWSRVSPKFSFRYRRFVVLGLPASHLPCR